MKRDTEGAKNTLNEESIKIQKIEAIKRLSEQANRIAAMKVKALAKKESAMLALATAVLGAKYDYQMSWQELAEELGGCVDHTTLYKFAMRYVWLKENTYSLLTLGINYSRKKRGLSELVFPSLSA